MKPHTFIVRLEFTRTDGIGNLARVTFEDPFVYDEDMIQGVKEALSNLYDVPESAVLSEQNIKA
jgi:hypothetical protein